jgi:putative redox protein
MEAKLELDGNMRIKGTSELGLVTYFDTHPQAGGDDTAPTPMDVMLQCLGACSFLDVIGILRKKRKQVDNLEIFLDANRAEEHPKVITDVHMQYVLTSPDAELSDLERAVELSKEKYCSVSAMFRAAGCNISLECKIKKPE